MSDTGSWKEKLEHQIPVDMTRDIDVFEGQMSLRQRGKLDEKVFAETRLRLGIYGQRYDNGQRHDGLKTQEIIYPAANSFKGPDTLWDAPGMQRIKIPFGGLTAEQLEILAQLANEYSNGLLHVTTRQDFQFHFVHIEDTPDLMRRLAAVGITTKEACGNSVRNISACPLAGVCHTESFDVSPYADALTQFLLGHDDVQDFGRKVKIAFSGCAHEACGLVKMHDLGFLAQVKSIAGEWVRGFDVYVGGGLGTIPHQAKLLAEFVAEEEILPLAQSVARVFARLGEKRNRNRARLKFLVAKLGIEEFRRLVREEREQLPYDARWTAYLNDLPQYRETALKPAVNLNGRSQEPDFRAWLETNVYRQRQPGYATVTINLPLGDLSSAQAFDLAGIARQYVGDNLRTTVEQNIVLRWVSEADLPALYKALKDVGLGDAGAGTIVDITSCPGTDTCKLGIAASRGLAGELRTQLAAQNVILPEAIKDLRIKISGCFNSCGQHHVADIGFFGNSRRRNNHTVPHFQVVLGGKWQENAGAYGLAVGAVPSRVVPEVLNAITNRYVDEREPGENFQDWTTRLGKKEIRNMLIPFTSVPAYEVNPTFYSDWGDPREFSIGDIGVGECAGEVVSLFAFEIAKAEGEAFDALLALEEGDFIQADQSAYQAMILAARALVRNQFLDVGDDADDIVAEFRRRYFDTQLFFDRYAKGKFAQYLFERHEQPIHNPDADSAQQLVEEANLFIEACHACDARLAGAQAGGVAI
ncbi:MAG: nitrite/sulfite reductase [Candidatus Promineifilaceae bacterium]|nr:nitrite/sulfite reductase [Candidatus Promineifilaceae bacterium]